MFKDKCEVGDLLLLKHGRYGKLISYTDFGKVVIPTNKVKFGYIKVIEIVREADNYTLVKAENVVVDYHDEIGYEEFLKVLDANGFKIGFDRLFETKRNTKEHEILAYNTDKGIIVVADTYDGGDMFNSIEVYIPNYITNRCKNPLFSTGCGTQSVFDLCYGRNLYYSLQMLCLNAENNEWNEQDDISLWTYADNDINTEIKPEIISTEILSSDLWLATIDRLLLADKEIEQLLGKCVRLKHLFALRDKININKEVQK